MNEKKIFLKKILSYFPFFEKIIRKIYNNFVYGTFFIPLNLDSNIEKTLHSKYFKLNNKNFKRFKNKYNYFLISKGKIFSSYPKKKTGGINKSNKKI